MAKAEGSECKSIFMQRRRLSLCITIHTLLLRGTNRYNQYEESVRVNVLDLLLFMTLLNRVKQSRLSLDLLSL